MDSYGQIGREKPDYLLDLDTLAQALLVAPVRVVLAERMTRYPLVLALAPRLQWLGAEVGAGLGPIAERWIFVAQERAGAGWLELGGATLAPGYVCQVMSYQQPGDGEVLSAFLADLSRVLDAAARAAA